MSDETSWVTVCDVNEHEATDYISAMLRKARRGDTSAAREVVCLALGFICEAVNPPNDLRAYLRDALRKIGYENQSADIALGLLEEGKPGRPKHAPMAQERRMRSIATTVAVSYFQAATDYAEGSRRGRRPTLAEAKQEAAEKHGVSVSTVHQAWLKSKQYFTRT